VRARAQPRRQRLRQEGEAAQPRQQRGVQALTPVFYPVEALPEGLRPWMRLNPLTHVVENMRRVVLWGLPPDWGALAAWTAVNAVLMMAGYAWFMKTKRAFADVL
jgi:lipopolysaccharide transport system permease protein